MRTRSKVSSETIGHAASDKEKKDTEKRKRKDDDSALGDARHRSKRCKISFCAEDAIASQSMTLQVKSPPKRKHHSSADPERAAEDLSASKNADDGVFAMTLEKFVGALWKRGAADRSSPNATGPRKQGQSCDHTHTLDDHHGRDNEKSSEGVAIEQCSSRNKSVVKRRHTRNSLGGCLEGSIQGEQNGSPTTLPLSCRRSGKSKCRPGNIKQLNNQRKESIGSTSREVSQQSNSCYSRKRLSDAKSRWKILAWSILRAKISPEILASASEDLVEHQIFSDVGEQIRSIANSQNYKTQSLPKKRRKPFAAANALAVDQRPVKTGRMRQKVRKQQLRLLKRMKTWLTEANFLQSAKEENSNDVGEEFIMTEVERHAFAQTMVKSCQENPNMRTIFLESVRMLTSSGLMQAAASNLLQQGPCEEAQNVMNTWADFKEHSAIAKTLPTNLLNAVNQLHEKRGDLSTNLSMPNGVGICTLSKFDEQTWKFQLPGSPLEDENSLLPSVTESLGQKDTAV